MTHKPRKIWDLATPLNKAWLRFSDSKLRANYESELGSQSVPIIDPNSSGFEKVLIGLRELTKIANSPARQKKMVQDMQMQLAESLRSNRLVAVAYPLWPSPARIPRYIGPEFWASAEIDWEGETAQDQSAKLHRIRIFDPADFPGLELNPPIGRKTHKQFIYWAISELLGKNPEFKNQVHKAKCDQIRKFIKLNCKDIDPNGRGWGDDAIRKHVSAYFRQNSVRN